MIYYGSFKDINASYDEVWLIVRSLKTMPNGSNIIHVPTLSPSTELFHDYMNWQAKGQWNRYTFENQYKPRFIEEMKNPECVMLLNTLKEKSKTSNILLVCYCQDESLCHRSIIKELLQPNDFYCLIAGSRTYSRFPEMMMVTDYLLSKCKARGDIMHIVSGGAKGADTFAKLFASYRGYLYHEFPADWDRYGKSAGYRRNTEMHDYISQFPHRACICFWDGESKGTQHNFKLCEEHDTPLRIYNYKIQSFVVPKK